jgi:hypothetical protein
MPRAIDKYPSARGAGRDSLYSPLRGTLNYEDPLGQIDSTAQQAGQQIGDKIDNGAFDMDKFVVDLYNSTGIDLSGLANLVHLLLGQGMMTVNSSVPVAAIADSNPNYLTNPHFDTTSSLSGGNIWTWDGNLNHSATGGCASVTGDGTLLELASEPATPVQQNQMITAGAFSRWRGVATADTGPAIQLAVVIYDDTGATLDDHVIASVSGPSIDSFNLVQQVTATTCRLVLRILPNVLTGKIWWDDGSLYKSAKLDPLIVGGIDIFNSIAATIQGTWDFLVAAFTGKQMPSGQSADSLKSSAAAVATGAAVAQMRTETLTGYFNQPRVIPAYAGFGADDVAFDQAFIDGTTSPGLGNIIFVPLRVKQDRLWPAVKFGIDTNSMTNFYIAVYAADQSSGTLSKVIDLGDCKSSINPAIDQQIVAIPNPPAVQRGELYYVAFLQVGGTAAAMHRWSSTANWLTGLYPRWLGNIHNITGFTAFPTTILASDIGSGTKYFAAMGESTPTVTPGSLLFQDPFTRPNSDALGGSWVLRAGSSMEIFDNAVQPDSFFGLSLAGFHTYRNRLGTLSQRNKIRVLSVGTVPFGISDAAAFRLGVRGNGLGKMIVMQVMRNVFLGSITETAKIFQCSNYSDCANIDAGTERATSGNQVTGDWLAVHDFEIQASGNAYTVYRDGAQIIQWVDSGGLYPINDSFTELGLGGRVTFGGGSVNIIGDNWEGADL